MRRALDGHRFVAGVRGVVLARRRGGFTLVELLISISIFVILATISLSAFRGSDKDKITAASRQVQAVFNGARSRAAKSGESRGVRLLLDPADPRCVNALQYIGNSSYHTGNVRVQIAPSDASGPLCRLVCEEIGEWADLNSQGLLETTARIRIPQDSSGRWYTMANINFAAGTAELRSLPTGATWDPAPSGWDNASLVPGGNPAPPPYSPTYQFAPRNTRIVYSPTNPFSPIPRLSAPAGYSNTKPIPYLLRLEPQPLPNTTPINLPPGVVIDLDASRVPAAWRQSEDIDHDGTLDPGEDIDGDGQLNFSGRYAPNNPIPSNLDILFGPNGTATGEFAALGPLFLTIAHISDVELARPMRVVDGTTTQLSAIVPGDYQESYGTSQNFPNKDRRVVAIYPQTGNVFISLVNGVSTNGYRLADNPFDYAYAGRDSK